MKPNRKLWQWLGVVFVVSFAALGWLGREIYLAAPPIPEAAPVITATLSSSRRIASSRLAPRWVARPARCGRGCANRG